MLDEERKAIARRAYDAINHKDMGLLDGHPGYWQTRQVFPMLFMAFPDLAASVEQQTVDGEWVTTRITLRGTHMGEFMGVAPTGQAIEIMQISLDQVAGGKLVEHFRAYQTGSGRSSPLGSWPRRSQSQVPRIASSVVLRHPARQRPGEKHRKRTKLEKRWAIHASNDGLTLGCPGSTRSKTWHT